MANLRPEVRSNATSDAKIARADMRLEVVVIPVSDVDRAKQFYGNLGWRLDADFPFDNGFRVVQFTPPGSGCSVQFGTNNTSAAPGSALGSYLIVSNIEAARDELFARGVEVSDVFHAGTPGAQFQPDGTSDRVSGPALDHASYRSYATFSDPDGNGWLLQEVTTRLPGRIEAAETEFALRRLLTVSTRSAPGSATRTGRTGTPRTWWRSRLAKTCPNEQLRCDCYGSARRRAVHQCAGLGWRAIFLKECFMSRRLDAIDYRDRAGRLAFGFAVGERAHAGNVECHQFGGTCVDTG